MLSRKWIIFILTATFYFVAYFHRISITIIAEDLMRDFLATATSIGLFSSLYFITYGVMQIPSGLLIDKFGSRKSLSVFCLTASVGTLVFAISQDLVIAMLGRALVGLGVSIAFICATKLIAFWFDVKSFASLIGILVSIGNSAALIGSAPFAILVTGIGWRTSFLLIAGGTLLLTISLLIWVRDRPNGMYNPKSSQSSSPKNFKMKTESPFLGMWSAFKNRDFWLVAFPPMFFVGSFFCFQGLWGMPYLMQVHGLNKIESSIMIMMIGLGFFLGAPFWGLVSDKLNTTRKRIFVTGVIFYTFIWFVLISPVIGELISYFSIILFLMGFFFGVMPLSIVMITELFPLRMIGAVTGSANTFPFIGIALFQIIFGYLLDRFGLIGVVDGIRIFSESSYQLGLTFCFISLIFATLIALFIRESE
ncbi:MAG: MFS transporter [Candidatus Bathyarchaeota archaeon]|nr:MFS transporter [Candidatus Bathyarchaeota archaeon]